MEEGSWRELATSRPGRTEGLRTQKIVLQEPDQRLGTILSKPKTGSVRSELKEKKAESPREVGDGWLNEI